MPGYWSWDDERTAAEPAMGAEVVVARAATALLARDNAQCLHAHPTTIAYRARYIGKKLKLMS